MLLGGEKEKTARAFALRFFFITYGRVLALGLCGAGLRESGLYTARARR